jgi:two-component sensor histidine kinase/CHASE3 domain sensor protein
MNLTASEASEAAAQVGSPESRRNDSGAKGNGPDDNHPDHGAHPDIAVADRRRRRRAGFGAAAGFALLATACLAAGILAVQADRASDAVLGDWQKRRLAELALDELRDAETDQRGFLITNDAAYLERYRRAVDGTAQCIGALRRTVAGDPAHVGLVDHFEAVARDKLGEMDGTIGLAQSGKREAALARVQTGAGKALMQDADETIARLADSIQHDIDRATARQRSLADVLLAAIVGATIGVVVLAFVLLRDARQQFRLLETRDASLRSLAQSLQQRVAERTRSLSEVNQRFAIALRASGVTVFTQDTALRYTWVHTSPLGVPPAEMLGRTDYEVLSPRTAQPIVSLKKSVVETGAPARAEVLMEQADADKWYDLTVLPLAGPDGVPIGIIAGAVDITQRKQQEAHIRLLLRELTHRSKNLLAVVEAIMRQTAANALSPPDFMARFSARLQSLAASHDLLVQEDWVGVSLDSLIRSQLQPYADLVGAQVSLSGGPLKVSPQAAQHIGMAAHELANNAAKYGALSVPGGKVSIAWQLEQTDGATRICRLSWTETDGPPVASPHRSGFGRAVIERIVARAVHGKVDLVHLPSGVVWTLLFPLPESVLPEA